MPRNKLLPYRIVSTDSAGEEQIEALARDSEMALYVASHLSRAVTGPVIVTGVGRTVIAVFRDGAREQ